MDKSVKKRALREGVELPSVLAFGRGYGEPAGQGGMDATTRFNRMTTMSDPYSGGINPVMARVAGFDQHNAFKYSVDPNPELDQFVDTLFLYDLGPEATTINGENPYRLLEKIQSGETINTPSMPAPMPTAQTKNTEAIDDSFLDFASMFGEPAKK